MTDVIGYARIEDGKLEVSDGVSWYPPSTDAERLLGSALIATMAQREEYGRVNTELHEELQDLKDQLEAMAATAQDYRESWEQWKALAQRLGEQKDNIEEQMRENTRAYSESYERMVQARDDWQVTADTYREMWQDAVEEMVERGKMVVEQAGKLNELQDKLTARKIERDVAEQRVARLVKGLDEAEESYNILGQEMAQLVVEHLDLIERLNVADEVIRTIAPLCQAGSDAPEYAREACEMVEAYVKDYIDYEELETTKVNQARTIRLLREALGAYRSALRSGEGESIEMMAIAEAALAAAWRPQKDEETEPWEGLTQ